MTFSDYIAACKKFAAETAEWGDLDRYKHYTTTGSGWEETCDNSSGGIDVSWAFHTNVDRETAWKHYIGALEAIMEQAEDEGWDDDQLAVVKDLFSDLMGG